MRGGALLRHKRGQSVQSVAGPPPTAEFIRASFQFVSRVIESRLAKVHVMASATTPQARDKDKTGQTYSKISQSNASRTIRTSHVFFIVQGFLLARVERR